jgi:hypothetical protein
MRVEEIFQRDIGRNIPEVICVDRHDTMAEEIEEYVLTPYLLGQMEAVFDSYQETIRNPSGHTNVWVSGFFGSGKSHFVKMLGYLAENPAIDGRTVLERFTERVDAPRLEALLRTSHSEAPALSVLVDMSTSQNVAREGESIVLPMYRALLERLDYSRNLMLAELEYALESDGDLAAFEAVFQQVSKEGRTWRERRHSGFAKFEASHALHMLAPEKYPNSDSWAKQVDPVQVDADWFAERALILLERRGDGRKRLVFIVDEVGQYVATSSRRILDLEALAVACALRRGAIWFVLTSQEEMGDSIQGGLLARIRDRFPICVDLLPNDIEDVICYRLLGKTAVGRNELVAQLGPGINQRLGGIKLASVTRGAAPSLDDLLRLYPFAPYQLRLLMDVVSAWRASSTSPILSGVNKTIISIAQLLVASPWIGVADRPAGDLVTMDSAYDLLESLVPADSRSVVDGISGRYGNESLEVRVTKVVALFAVVDGLPLTPDNISVLLHPSIAADSVLAEVLDALRCLTADGCLEYVDGAYRLSASWR